MTDFPWSREAPGGGGVTDHGALTGLTDDDHPQYLTEAEADALYALLAHLHDHGTLSGLADDDHPQYLTQAEADALYSILAHGHTHASLSGVTADQHHAELHSHASHSGIGTDDHHARDHSIIGATHTAFPGGTSTFLRADATFAAPVAAAADPVYSPGSFTVVTESGRYIPARMKLTGAQRATIQGTGRLVITN